MTQPNDEVRQLREQIEALRQEFASYVQAQKQKRRIEEEDRRFNQDPANQISLAVLREFVEPRHENSLWCGVLSRPEVRVVRELR